MNLLIFDMDGVLVDVSDSYRAAIQVTVEHFTAAEVTPERIQDLKNEGGWNDDWALSHKLIQDEGFAVPFQDVVDYFQHVFHEGGLMRRERWIPKPGLLEGLAERNVLTVFTGRLRWEANMTLQRFSPDLFCQVVGVDDVVDPKPAPEGLFKLREGFSHAALWYIGDTVDDARSASAAQVPFIGIAAPGSPRVAELARLLRDEGAIAVLDDINQLPGVVSSGVLS
ncbi:MAG: HAD hydrolase-like protein [Acidobacteriota bacterium]|nr:HAD hydrolase-like protein [Acidobacteriota bacterium]